MKLIDFETLKGNFNSRLSNVKNQSSLIENELEHIGIFIKHKLYYKESTSLFNASLFTERYKSKIEILDEIYSKVRYGWDTFLDAYEHYLLNLEEKEIEQLKFTSDITDEEKNRIEERNTICLKQGTHLAKYLLWLKEKQKASVPIKNKKQSITHKQKMLILYYLGIEVSEQDNTKIAKILSQVLELSEENTRRYLSWVKSGKNNVRTKNNLKTIKALFDTNNLKEISNKIQEDIDSLK